MKKVLVLFLTSLLLSCTMSTVGKYPQGDEVARLEKSANYDNKTFQNENKEVVKVSSGGSLFGNAFKVLFRSSSNDPSEPLPIVKQKIDSLSTEKPSIIWFGHSSYLISYKGFNILVDPVLNSFASPLPFLNEAYPYTDNYSTDDLPMIDLLVITHDHYDHLEYDTLNKLRGKVKKIITPLGVASHLKHWGYSSLMLEELDWYQSSDIAAEIKITATPAQHFSGRDFTTNKTLWSSYVLELGGYKLYLGGDGGYGKHFKDIGEKFGKFDLAILESGQYDKDLRNIHLFPSDVLLAAKDLNADVILPVHWAKFTLSFHGWDEPIQEILKLSKDSEAPQTIATPMIGEIYTIGDVVPTSKWWVFD